MSPRIPGQAYLYDQPIYDTVRLAAAAGPLTYNFFTVPLHGLLAAALPKTYVHTNLINTGVLEKGFTFQITGLSLYLNETAQGGAVVTYADALTAHHGDIRLMVGQREYLRLPAAMIPAGGAELIYFSNITPAATEFHTNRGVSAISNRFHLTSPIDIESQESIVCEYTVVGTIAAVTDITLVLWGNMQRTVS